MKNLKTTIRSITTVAPDFYELCFDWDPAAGVPRPGQFLTVRAAPSCMPLLRRPFAFSAWDTARAGAALIFQRKGPGTAVMAGYRPGDTLDCIGPLGNSFSLPEPGVHPVLVAGGIGLGPMLFLAERIMDNGCEPLFVFGARTAKLVPLVLEQQRGFSPVICTDDGSRGFAGNVVEYLRSVSLPHPAGLFCCGPHPMLRGCCAFAAEKDIPCEVSVEQVMACGVGACMGCAVKTRTGYARACKEGPVFCASELVWT